jgi:arginase
MKQSIDVYGYASGNAAADSRCCMGPITMQGSPTIQDFPALQWKTHILPTSAATQLEAIDAVEKACRKLAQHTQASCQANRHFAVIGGDHSSAIGTWSGVASAKDGPLGMLWIDAHLDSHTPESSLSKNIHGMALACLLGQGDERLTNVLSIGPKLDPQHVVILGARDFESAESALLAELGVTVITMDKIIERGFSVCFQDALSQVSANPHGFGVSIDLDGLDPQDAPGTAILTEPGIRIADLAMALTQQVANHPQFLGLEIAEFFPDLDKNGQTEQVIATLMQAAFAL